MRTRIISHSQRWKVLLLINVYSLLLNVIWFSNTCHIFRSFSWNFWHWRNFFISDGHLHLTGKSTEITPRFHFLCTISIFLWNSCINNAMNINYRTILFKSRERFEMEIFHVPENSIHTIFHIHSSMYIMNSHGILMALYVFTLPRCQWFDLRGWIELGNSMKSQQYWIHAICWGKLSGNTWMIGGCHGFLWIPVVVLQKWQRFFDSSAWKQWVNIVLACFIKCVTMSLCFYFFHETVVLV